jgi:hypothetical protein
VNTFHLAFILAAVLFMVGAAQASTIPAHTSEAARNGRACASKTVRTSAVPCEDTLTGRVMGVSESYGGANGAESDFRTRGVLGACTMEVRSDDGTLSNIQAVSSSIFHPTGTRIRWGMKIKAVGHTVGGLFVAREITVLQYSPQ